ncbi:MAG TPA: CDP-diacylglycerol--serine O-phosphatidyltransferase [Candidatus Kapabacteria bacterium]|nr:CDP-diacylglycerol--serine O-phosphatidyltransferase [Candidatus Kapabacteria bacterium]
MRISRSIVPNLFTLANLFCGFSAIIAISDGKFFDAGLFILFAGIFDALDGFVARLTRSASPLGVQLDSLCDATSFGVAPSFLLYEVCLQHSHTFGILLASIPALAGVFRLARFNVELTSLEDKKYFTGMPIPAGALTVVSYVLFFGLNTSGTLFSQSIDGALVGIIVGLTMVSRIKYDNLPRPSLKGLKESPLAYILFIILCGSVLLTKGYTLFPFMVLYMVFGASRHIYNTIIKTKKKAK